MSKLIQIILDPDWNESQLIATGVTNSQGFELSPAFTTIKAKQLPEPHLSTWNHLVKNFQDEGCEDGNRYCTSAIAEPILISGENGNEDYSIIRITTVWKWDDGRIIPPKSIDLSDPNTISIFNFLLSQEAYAYK